MTANPGPVSDYRSRPLALRRREFEVGILIDLADVMDGDVWGSWMDHAEELGLSDRTVQSVMNKVQRDLNARALRLAGPLTRENT